MATYEDSKPFVGLQQDAKEFQSLLSEGVKTCLDHLDSKLGSLVCDPDSLQHLSKDSKRLNAHMEFTKAKYEIFMHMKLLVEEVDAEWQKKMNNMINNFLENVEILLAGMKLESIPKVDHKESQSISKGRNVSPSSIISSMSPYSLLNTAKRIPVLNSFLPKEDETEDHAKDMEVESSDEDNEVPERTPPQRRFKNSAVKRQEPEVHQKKNSRKSILKTEAENALHTTPSRSTRKRTAVKETIQSNNDIAESNESDCEILTAAPRTPKNVHFSVGFDVHEDLDIYSPEIKLTRSAPRRKTVLIKAAESTPNLMSSPARTKRKTIGGGMDASVAPSPKRIKRGTRASIAPPISEESDLLESDESTSAAEHYTSWQLLDELDAKIPAQPGVYELKVYKAKKSAYIGSCDNLLQKITLHKVGHASGHRHLDKFLERNRRDVQVRFERMASAEQAKSEEMSRIRAFVEQHKTTPAYN